MQNTSTPKQTSNQQPSYISYPNQTQLYTCNHPQGYHPDRQPSCRHESVIDLTHDVAGYQPSPIPPSHGALPVHRPVVNPAQQKTRYHPYASHKPAGHVLTNPPHLSASSTSAQVWLAGWDPEPRDYVRHTSNVPSFVGSKITFEPIPQATRQVPPERSMHQPQQTARVVEALKPEPAEPATLPTGESKAVLKASKRSHIEGFPDILTPLPADIQEEEIIKQWPNHLWGPLLLRIAVKFSPKEIGALNGANIKPNTIIKRMTIARAQANVTEDKEVKAPRKEVTKRKRASAEEEDQEKEGKKRKRASAKGKGKGKEKETEKEEDDAPPAPDAPESEAPESAAALAFRLQQEAMHDAMVNKDPGFYNHQMTVKKKNPKRYRQLLEQVVQEREGPRQQQQKKAIVVDD